MADSLTVNKIFNEYEELRTKASNERKIRIDEVYSAVPRIKEIDDEIYSLGFSNMQNILKNPEEADKYNSEMKEKFRVLKSEKQKLIEENNISADYDEYKYECDLCGDTGYTPDGKKCVCYKQKLINEAYAKSNLGDILDKQNFDTFSFNYYSKEKGNEEKSPYENMEKIFKRVKEYCDNFENEKKSLLFYGTAGLGKTFLSSCIAKDIIEKEKTVIYTRATQMFSVYEDYKFGRISDRSIINDLYNFDLLIIDDLGAEAPNKNNAAFLFDLVSDRLSENKKIIINTNLKIRELVEAYSERFVSRVYENFELLRFFGDDIRVQKFKNS